MYDGFAVVQMHGGCGSAKVPLNKKAWQRHAAVEAFPVVLCRYNDFHWEIPIRYLPVPIVRLGGNREAGHAGNEVLVSGGCCFTRIPACLITFPRPSFHSRYSLARQGFTVRCGCFIDTKFDHAVIRYRSKNCARERVALACMIQCSRSTHAAVPRSRQSPEFDAAARIPPRPRRFVVWQSVERRSEGAGAGVDGRT